LGAAARDGRGSVGSVVCSLLDEPAVLLQPPPPCCCFVRFEGCRYSLMNFCCSIIARSAVAA
jgi:hypothetical protein